MPSEKPKRILYHGPTSRSFEGLARSVAAATASGPFDGGAEITVLHEGQACTLVDRPGRDALVEDLRTSYVNLLVLDTRCDNEAAPGEHALEILDALDKVLDVEDRYGFHRILVLVGGGAESSTDDLILKLGARGVGRVLRHPECHGPEAVDPAFGKKFLQEARLALGDRKPGKRAICAAGGGITGIFFELGVLKCLDDCLDAGGVNDFDMYFGISAGAVVTGPISVGYSVDEFMAAVAGVPGGRIEPLDLRLFQLGHVDFPGFARRWGAAARSMWGGFTRRLRRGEDLSREQLLFDYVDLVAPPFRADRFEETLARILSAKNATNDFRDLDRPLFVGATDQDERRHVLFGDEEHRHVPISRAIQASLSINPAFSATPILGRYYEDGAVTRTSNFVEAMRRGSTLIFVVDPFLPYVARTPGFNDRRGALYNMDQDVRTISYTRYETTRNWVLRKHPHVSSYTFVPANRQRRLISQNPMDHRPYLEIWRGAYLSTLKRLSHVSHRLEGDLRVHGFGMDLSRAEAVAEQLEGARALSFADFFPDRRARIKTPPLVGQRRLPAAAPNPLIAARTEIAALAR